METMEIIVATTDIVKMKNDIKTLAEKQKFLRNQRKTVHIVGERQLPAGEAGYMHITNKNKLRILYAAYGIARGKTFKQIESSHSEENHPLMTFQRQIDYVLKSYELKNE
jgi:hypothetical protein